MQKIRNTEINREIISRFGFDTTDGSKFVRASSDYLEINKIIWGNPRFQQEIEESCDDLNHHIRGDGLDFHKRWINRVIKNPQVGLKTPCPKLIRTERGELSRSYSEKILSDAMFNNNISFRTEVLVHEFKDNRMDADYSIDFYYFNEFKKIKTRKIYIELWGGAAGRMSNQDEYKKRKQKKIRQYKIVEEESSGDVRLLSLSFFDLFTPDRKQKTNEEIYKLIQVEFKNQLNLDLKSLQINNLIARLTIVKAK